MVIETHEIVSRLKQLADELGKTPTLKQLELSGISKRQIHKHKYSELCKMAGLDPNRRPQNLEPFEIMVRPPRILIFDVELSDMLVRTYSLRNDYISPNNIVKDWFFLSYAAKFWKEDKFFYLDNRYALDTSDDRQIVEGLHHLLESADIVVGHNMKSFDLKKLNARILFYNLPPIKDVRVIDTLKILRRIAAITSNSLDYIGKYLNLKNRKSNHGKFAGKSLFDECMKGNFDAWVECELYNKQDCVVTEELFEYLMPHDKSINFQSFTQQRICSCGSKEFKKNGFKHSPTGVFQMFICIQCSKHHQHKENLIDKEVKKEFLK
jgi:DNA polymerase elongation subunit (family B)